MGSVSSASISFCKKQILEPETDEGTNKMAIRTTKWKVIDIKNKAGSPNYIRNVAGANLVSDLSKQES